METTEVLQSVQRITLDCMASKKPIHITVGIMPEISNVMLTVQDRNHEVVYMETFNDWMPDHEDWNRRAYDRFVSVISGMIYVRIAG